MHTVVALAVPTALKKRCMCFMKERSEEMEMKPMKASVRYWLKSCMAGGDGSILRRRCVTPIIISIESATGKKALAQLETSA